MYNKIFLTLKTIILVLKTIFKVKTWIGQGQAKNKSRQDYPELGYILFWHDVRIRYMLTPQVEIQRGNKCTGRIH